MASTWTPNLVWNSTTWAITASAIARSTDHEKIQMPLTDILSRNGSTMVVFCPSAMISASPEAADRVPRVTMKSVIPPLEISRPLISPTTPAATKPASAATPIPVPAA